MISDHLMSHGMAETPWGGFKQSGTGRTHSHLDLEAMTQPRVVVDDWLPFAQKDMWWYPHGRKVYEGLKGAMVAFYGEGAVARLGVLLRLMPTFLRTFRK